MSSDETPDPEERPSEESAPTTDRRSFLSAVGAGAVPIALGDDPRSLAAGTQTTGSLPWTESFDVDDGATSDDAETAWEIENADAHPGVAVEAGALTARTTNGTARWRSEPIDVSAASSVDVAVTVRGSGNLRAPPERDLPAVTGSSSPTDPDHDGIYEDVDGDGTADTDDAKTLLNNLDDPEVTRAAAAYDQNCNDRLDYIDVIALGHEARGDEHTNGDCVRVGDHLTVAYVLDGNRTVVDQRTDVSSDGETIEATGLSGDELVVEITAQTSDPRTAYHVEKVSVARPEDAAPDETTFVADRAPDGSRLTSRPDGPVHHMTEGTTHLFTWDELGPGARAVLYDEDETTDWGGGPDLHLYDTMERPGASAGDVPSKVATRGQWSHYKRTPELQANGHSGAYSARVQHQDTINKFVARFPETTEVFLSYCVKIPDGKAMPGAAAPGEFGKGSTWKLAWLFHEETGGDVDIVLPAYSGSEKFNLHSNSLDNVLWVSDNSWWQWGEWMRLSFWLESGPEPESDPGRIRFQAVTEGEQTRVLVDETVPIMEGGTPPFAWKQLNIPGWAQNKRVSGDNVEALYDDIYLATGDDANARVELSDSADYGASTRMQLCDVRSWSSNRVSAILRKGSLDSVENATIHLTTADEQQAVSMELN